MAEKTNFCPFCGTKIDMDSYYCHNCGANLKQISKQTNNKSQEDLTEIENKATNTTEIYHIQKQNNGRGIFSIIFAFLSIIGILPLFGSLAAIFTGGWKAGPLGAIGRTLGWFSFIFYMSFAIMMFV